MKTITLNVPDSVDEIELKMQLASHLFKIGMFSSGQAAKFVGLTKRGVLESVGNYGVSIFGENAEDLDKIING